MTIFPIFITVYFLDLRSNSAVYLRIEGELSPATKEQSNFQWSKVLHQKLHHVKGQNFVKETLACLLFEFHLRA